MCSLTSKAQKLIRFFFFRFDDLFWVKFPMVKGMFFTSLRRKFPIQEAKENVVCNHYCVNSGSEYHERKYKCILFSKKSEYDQEN